MVMYMEEFCRNQRPWSNLLIMKDLVVCYTSQVDIAISSYL